MKPTIVLVVGIALGASAGRDVRGSQAAPPDAVVVSPNLYQTKLENDRVRVLDYALQPGQSEPMHSHQTFVVHFLTDGRIRSTPLGGQSAEQTVKQGDTAWREPMAHRIDSIGTTELRALIVDVKPCGKAQ
jgi:quercetin dioxygenase-like cupin family protein